MRRATVVHSSRQVAGCQLHSRLSGPGLSTSAWARQDYPSPRIGPSTALIAFATVGAASSLLAAHPVVDETLHREVASLTRDRLPTTADLPHLPYTRSVLAESLRLIPPAWIIARRALESHRIGSTEVPPGSLVV